MRFFAKSTIFAAFGHAACLDDQPGRFRYRHEVPLYVRMRDRHRPALGYLPLEQGYDTAIGAEHIAEPDCSEDRFRSVGVILHDHLAHAFRGTHDARRIHRFVGGDENEVGCFVAVGGVDHVEGAEDVVLHRLARAYLHQGDVLVRRSVEDGRGSILLEHLVYARRIAHVADLDDHFDVVVFRH